MKIRKNVVLTCVAILLLGLVILSTTVLSNYLDWKSHQYPNVDVAERNSTIYVKEPEFGEFLGKIEFTVEPNDGESYWTEMSAYDILVMREMSLDDKHKMDQLVHAVLFSHYLVLGKELPSKNEYKYSFLVTNQSLIDSLDRSEYLVQ